jgi:hypothetical protein
MPATRVEPKSMIFTVPVGSIITFCGRRSWCSISSRWNAVRPFADLLDDAAHRLDRWLRVVDEPLVQRLAVDEFGDGVEEFRARARARRFHHVCIADALRDPVFHEERSTCARSARSSVDSVLMTTGAARPRSCARYTWLRALA